LFADYGKTTQGSLSLPLVALLACPERYSDKKVRVYGVLCVDERTISLAMSPDVIDMGDQSSSLDLYLDAKTIGVGNDEIKKLHGAFVVVEGIVENQSTNSQSAFYPIILHDVSYIGYRGKPLMRGEVLRRFKEIEGVNDMKSEQNNARSNTKSR
jgi:hypothetical protein